ERNRRLFSALPTGEEGALQRSAHRLESLGILPVAQRLSGIDNDLGIGDQRVAHHPLAQQGRPGKEQPACGQRSSDQTAQDRRYEAGAILLAHGIWCPSSAHFQTPWRYPGREDSLAFLVANPSWLSGRWSEPTCFR